MFIWLIFKILFKRVILTVIRWSLMFHKRQLITNIYVEDIRILVPSKIIQLFLKYNWLISKISHTKRFWYLLCKDSVQFTRKSSGNLYLDVLRILVSPQKLVNQPKNRRETEYVSLISTQDPTRKSDFDMYHQVIFNFFNF